VSVEQIQIPSSLGVRHGEKALNSTSRCYLRYKLFDSEPVLTKCKLIESSINDIDLLKCSFKFSKQHIFNKSAQLLWYLNEEQLEIQLWLTNDNQEFKSKPSEKDRLIGSVYVNMDSFNMDNHASAKSLKTKKFYRINGLYPIYKIAHNDLSQSFCEINLTLEKLNDITESSTCVISCDNDTTNEHDKTMTIDSKNSFVCIIGIERASHLPLVHDRLLNRHVEPNAYVTYSNAKTKNLSFTKIFEHTINPIWNYQETTLFSLDHLFDDSKCLILKVWHKINLDLEQQTPEKSGDKVIGFVSIDLSPLMSGLQQISGWYNIIDLVGQCQGQLKVNICPQQNLFEFKRNYLSNKSKIPNKFNQLKPYEDNIERHLSNIRLHHESLRNNNNNYLSSDISYFDSNNTTESCLKTNLRKQLDDLDKINEKLKEKLRVSNSNTLLTPPIQSHSELSSIVTSVNKVNNEQELEPKVDNNLKKYLDEHTRQLQNAQEVLKKANYLINTNFTNLQRDEQPIATHETQKRQLNVTPSISTINDENNDNIESLPPKPSPSLIKINKNDSFWSSSLSSSHKSSRSSTPIETEHIQSAEIISEENDKKIVTFEDKFDEIIVDEEPEKINCVNDEDEDEENNIINENDTDLDQTNNLSHLNNNNNINYEDDENQNFDVIEIKPLNSISGMNFDQINDDSQKIIENDENKDKFFCNDTENLVIIGSKVKFFKHKNK
jgi:hypothetical protein